MPDKRSHSTKAEQITRLHRAGKSPREIAIEIFGEDYPSLQSAIGYVRTALRRKGRHENEAEFAQRIFDMQSGQLGAPSTRVDKGKRVTSSKRRK